MTDRTKELARTLRNRSPLPEDADRGERLAAAASAMRSAGRALSPGTRSPRRASEALAELERLAGLEEGELRRRFAAVRALDIHAGECVAGTLIGDAPIQSLVEAAGGIPTADPEDRAGGILGGIDEGRGAAGVKAGARIADPGLRDGAGIRIRDRSGELYAEPAGGHDPADTITAIDRIGSRSAAAGKAAAGPRPVGFVTAAPDDGDTDGDGDDILFTSWRPANIFEGARPHPHDLVESTALASTDRPVLMHAPKLDPRTVASGALSDMQIEEIAYAGQAHAAYLASDPNDPSAPPPRRGYLLGAGAGTGKGRINCGIIMDNWNHGRRRAVYISENQRLLGDLIRDWTALGGRPNDIVKLTEFTPDEDLPKRDGVIFTTWALLRDARRVDQIAAWAGPSFDGPVIGDECQNCRHALTRNDSFFSEKNRSLQGRAFIRLQGELPNARVVYSSATSAADIAGMGYAVRLGLWGRGTPFPSADAFFKAMDQGGMNALELVARDLKAMGLYSAPSLSFKGITYDRLDHPLTDTERRIQDDLAETWATVSNSLRRIMVTNGMSQTGTGRSARIDPGRPERSRNLQNLNTAKIRFFQNLLSALKAKPLIRAIRRDLSDGKRVVIQTANTYQADAERAIAEADGSDLDDVEATPKGVLLKYIREQFPVRQYRVVNKGRTQTVEPVLDAGGNPVDDPQAVAERDRLVRHVESLIMPEGPLEQIMDSFGPEEVAEATGRTRRLVTDPGGARRLEERAGGDVDEDVRRFRKGDKRILVFSASGGTGASYHDEIGTGIRHYLLQPGYRADQAIQGMGRSHRSDEVTAPEYVLVSTDLWSDRRMISNIASGMETLGAITRGQRQAASQELFSPEDNLEGPLAQEAWENFISDLRNGRIPNLSAPQFEHETGLPLHTGRGTHGDVPSLRRFLNAMAGMTCDKQEAFGDAFHKRLEEVRVEAVRNGRLDRGIETLEADSLIKLEDTVIHRDPDTGASTRLLKMLRSDPVEPVAYADARRKAMRLGNSRFVQSAVTGRVAMLAFPRLRKGTAPGEEDGVTVITPWGERTKRRREVVAERWQPISPEYAENLWSAELQQVSGEEDTVFHVAAGCLLPLWDKLPKNRVTVYQMITDDGERILGRVMPEEWADQFVARVNAAHGGGIDPDTALDKLEAGEVATLSNGWVVEGRSDRLVGTGEIRVNIHGEDSSAYRDELEAEGLHARPDPLRTGHLVYVLPHDADARRAAWRSLTAVRPVVGVTNLQS